MKRVFPVLAISTFSAMLGVGIIAPLLPLYAESLGASGIWIGVIFAGFSISRSIFLPIVGRMSDLRGRRVFICTGLLIYAAISLGYIWANGVWQLTLIRLLHGFASAMIIPVAQAYIGDLSPQGEEGRWMGYFNAAFFTGFGFGPLLGGAVSHLLSADAAFSIMGGLNLVAFLMALLFLPEVRPERAEVDLPRVSLLKMTRSRTMRGLISFRMVYALGRSALMSFLPLFAASSLGLTEMEIGILLAAHILLVSTTQLFSGRVADAFNRRVLVIVGSLISLSFLALVPQMHSFWQLLALALFGAFGGAVSMPAASALTVEEGKRYGMGSAVGVFTMAMSVGMAVGPLIGGAVADAWEVESVFYFAGAAGLLGTGLFVWFTR